MTAAIHRAEPRERPILFKGRLVRAILAGTKTQTRRVIKPQPAAGCRYEMNGARSHALHLAGPAEALVFVPPTPRSKDHRLTSPYGAPGDRLWVRETWALAGGDADVSSAEMKLVPHPEHAYREALRFRADGDGYDESVQAWRPSIFMPRWASRIDLEVTEVRVQRLQDITEEDAIAEGVEPAMFDEHWTAYDPDTEGYPSFGVDPRADPRNARLESVRHHPAKPMPGDLGTARGQFERLWDTINGPRGFGWDSNPWVWAITFRRVRP